MTDRAVPRIWTIGHSNLSLHDFLGRLTGERLEFVVDVRSYPYSRFAPHFNREALEPALLEAQVRYLFLGEALGGRPSDGNHYDAEGHALYGAMAQAPAFRQAIDRLLRGARDHRIALLCSEGQPHECHRRLLVGKVLVERGAELHHILPDGGVCQEREVRSDSMEQGSLFGGDEAAWRSTRSVSHRRRLSTSSSA
ncbi:MAG: DUF488 domain-containing protein [Actinomycetota bacterium]|nr:DUF488 domain-containing protein [Actinomycetota bacterium]